jgi:hypothetical protein
MTTKMAIVVASVAALLMLLALVGFGAFLAFHGGMAGPGAFGSLDHRLGSSGPMGWWSDGDSGQLYGADPYHHHQQGRLRYGFGRPMWPFFPFLFLGIPFFLLIAGLVAGFFIWRSQQNQ